MGVIVKGDTYTPAPEGVHQAVCVDVVDLGEVETTYDGETKLKPMVKIVWQINEVNPETGKRFAVSRRYGAYLSEKSSLRKDLQSWRGRAFTKDELKGFDLDNILGINCQLNLAHNEKDGKTFANVAAIMPLMKGMAKIEALDYVREQDRPKDGQNDPGAVPHDEIDESIPF